MPAGWSRSLNPETGALIQQGRLKVPSDRYYASPVAGDGKIYISSESGKVLVLPPGGGLDALAVNDLQDNIYATPALVGQAHLHPHVAFALLLRIVARSSTLRRRRSYGEQANPRAQRVERSIG